MRVNPYIQYYNNQVGNGIAAFSGVRYQRGHGFFGRLFSSIGSIIKSLAPTLIQKSLPSAIGLANDVIEGKNVGKSTLSRLGEAGINVAEGTIDHFKKQRGSGMKMMRKRYNAFYRNSKRKVNKRAKRRRKR